MYSISEETTEFIVLTP